MTRWNLSIVDETDRAVHAFLSRNEDHVGDLSQFVNDAVRRRVMELTISRVKDRNDRYDQSEIFVPIDEEAASLANIPLKLEGIFYKTSQFGYINEL